MDSAIVLGREKESSYPGGLGFQPLGLGTRPWAPGLLPLPVFLRALIYAAALTTAASGMGWEQRGQFTFAASNSDTQMQTQMP